MRVFVASLVVSLAFAVGANSAAAQAAELSASEGGRLIETSLAASAGVAQQTASPRIVDANPITSEKSPFTVALQSRSNLGYGGCSGTLVDATHVVTAAHCVKERNKLTKPVDIAVAAGSADLTTEENVKKATIVAVANVWAHPAYTDEMYENDVAVVQLARPLDLSGSKIKATRMVRSGANLFSESKFVMSGFGITGDRSNDWGTLRQATLTQVAANVCGGNSPASIVCALGKKQGTCNGDSGGPGVTEKGNALAAVTDFGPSGYCSDLVNGSANVAAPENRKFIDAAIQGKTIKKSALPKAPTFRGNVRLSGKAKVGSRVRCQVGRWTGKPRKSYYFATVRKDGTVIKQTRTRSSRYTIPKKTKGKRLACMIGVKNEGGSGYVVSLRPKKVR